MNAHVVWALARKDMDEVLANKLAWMPALAVPAIFTLVLPTIALLAPQLGAPPTAPAPPWLKDVVATLPPDLAGLVRGRPPHQAVPLLLLGQVFAPMFLMIPMIVATLIGANAFAGEKERRTLEPLLYAPLTDAELFAGKALAAWLPAVAITWIAFAAYAVVLNVGAWSFVGRVWFPWPAWWPLMFWVAPAIAGLAVVVTVIVSAKVGTFVEANQTAGALVLLVVGLLASQAAGVLTLTAPVALAIGAVVWLADAALLIVAVRRFSRAGQIGKI